LAAETQLARNWLLAPANDASLISPLEEIFMSAWSTKFFVVAALTAVLVPASASALTREFGYDRPGLVDYRSYDMANPRMVLYEYHCSLEAKCKAWTFVKPGVQGPQARCWLKYAVSALRKDPNCDSGAK
jgi:hypothetical protein